MINKHFPNKSDMTRNNTKNNNNVQHAGEDTYHCAREKHGDNRKQQRQHARKISLTEDLYVETSPYQKKPSHSNAFQPYHLRKKLRMPNINPEDEEAYAAFIPPRMSPRTPQRNHSASKNISQHKHSFTPIMQTLSASPIKRKITPSPCISRISSRYSPDPSWHRQQQQRHYETNQYKHQMEQASSNENAVGFFPITHKQSSSANRHYSSYKSHRHNNNRNTFLHDEPHESHSYHSPRPQYVNYDQHDPCFSPYHGNPNEDIWWSKTPTSPSCTHDEEYHHQYPDSPYNDYHHDGNDNARTFTCSYHHDFDDYPTTPHSTNSNSGHFLSGDDVNHKPATPNAMVVDTAEKPCMPEIASQVDFDVLEPPLTPVTQPSEELLHIPSLNKYDVLLGRGGGTNNQIGNINFRSLVRDFQPIYLTLKRKNKPLMARSLVLIVRFQGGRFLRKGDKTDEYYEVGDEKAEAKASQALREGLEVRATTRKRKEVYIQHKEAEYGEARKMVRYDEPTSRENDGDYRDYYSPSAYLGRQPFRARNSSGFEPLSQNTTMPPCPESPIFDTAKGKYSRPYHTLSTTISRDEDEHQDVNNMHKENHRNFHIVPWK